MEKISQNDSKKSYLILKSALLILAIIAFIVAAKFLGVQEILRNALEWIRNLGYWGPITFILIYILATVLFLPGSILTLGAGFLFGVLSGTFYVSIASILGATAAFLVGRYFARTWVEKQIAENEKFQAVDKAVAGEGWKIVLLTRLSPVFPFNLLNYAFGVTQVSLKDYFFASWIGMFPGTLMYVYFGSLAENLATLGSSNQPTTSAQWILRGVGLIATVAVTLYVTKIAKKALNEKVIAKE